MYVWRSMFKCICRADQIPQGVYLPKGFKVTLDLELLQRFSKLDKGQGSRSKTQRISLTSSKSKNSAAAHRRLPGSSQKPSPGARKNDSPTHRWNVSDCISFVPLNCSCNDAFHTFDGFARIQSIPGACLCHSKAGRFARQTQVSHIHQLQNCLNHVTYLMSRTHKGLKIPVPVVRTFQFSQFQIYLTWHIWGLCV